MNTRLVVAGLLLAGGTVVAFVGAAPQAALSPTEAHAVGEERREGVAVKGMVASVDGTTSTFHLTDDATELQVTLGHELPARVAPGTSLVAKGTLVRQGDTVVLQATEVVIGCPSKYEA